MARFSTKAKIVYWAKQIEENIPVKIESTEQDTIAEVSSASIDSGNTEITFNKNVEKLITPGVYFSKGDDIVFILSVSGAVVTTEGIIAGFIVRLIANTGTWSIVFGAKNAIPTTETTYNDEISSEQYEYEGEENDRDEVVVIKDRSATLGFTLFMPKTGIALNINNNRVQNPLVLANAPYANLFGAVGLSTIIPSTARANHALTYSNGTNPISNDFLTFEYRMETATEALAKTYTVTDCRGTIGVTLKVSEYAKMQLEFKGNVAVPTQENKLVPDWGQNKALIAPLIKAGSVTGKIILDGQTYKVCFTNITASNFSGVAYERLLLSCLETWSRTIEASDVSVTAIADTAADALNFLPERDLGKSVRVEMAFGGAEGLGSRTQIIWKNAKLTNISHGDETNTATMELTFRVNGNTELKMS